LNDQRFLRLPLLIIKQIVLKTAEQDAVPTEDIASFESIAQQPIDQEFISIGVDSLLTLLVKHIQMPLVAHRNKGGGDSVGCELPKRSSSLEGGFQELDGAEEGQIQAGRRQIDGQQQWAQVQFEPPSVCLKLFPVQGLLIKADLGADVVRDPIELVWLEDGVCVATEQKTPLSDIV
jgi:hypothetical protein